MRRDIASAANQPIFHVNLNGTPSKTDLFVAKSSRFAEHRFSNTSGRLSMFLVEFPLFPVFLLGTIHAPSKLYDSEDSLAEEAREIISEARSQCSEHSKPELVLCGDFNMNPFDKGMLGAANYHAVMDRNVALRGSRIIQGRDYPIMYSPMWSLLGDYPNGPAGSYYHSPSSHFTSHWHIPDQFLFSPSLLAKIQIDEVGIVSEDGLTSFLTEKGLINQKACSDHLPIRVKLKANN